MDDASFEETLRLAALQQDTPVRPAAAAPAEGFRYEDWLSKLGTTTADISDGRQLDAPGVNDEHSKAAEENFFPPTQRPPPPAVTGMRSSQRRISA